MTADNGRIKLTWAQIAWAVATLAAVVGAWADTRAQLALIRQEIALRVIQSEMVHGQFREQDEKLWRAVGDALADTKKGAKK